MEALIGFVVGYLVGAKEGKGGLERLRISLSAIASSPEARKLWGEAMSMAQPVAQRASSAGLSNLGGLAGPVIKQLVDRASSAREGSRAA